jgi:excisionase family DNA binding protein
MRAHDQGAHQTPTDHPGVTGRAGPQSLEPLAVSPRQACVLLGVGNTRLYELIRDGELVTYHEGRARRVTMESIHARVARLAGASGDSEAHQRGRPPKRPRAAARLSSAASGNGETRKGPGKQCLP